MVDLKICMILAVDQGETSQIRFLHSEGVSIPSDTINVLLSNSHLQTILDLVHEKLVCAVQQDVDIVTAMVRADDFDGDFMGMLSCATALRQQIMEKKCIERSHTHPQVAQADTCVLCLTQPVTWGFLHGNSIHECVCKTCADAFMNVPGCSEWSKLCPLCGAPVEAAFVI